MNNIDSKGLRRIEITITIAFVVVLIVLITSLAYSHQHNSSAKMKATVQPVFTVKLGAFANSVTTSINSNTKIPGVSSPSASQTTTQSQATTVPVKQGGPTQLTFLYDPIDNPNKQLLNACHDYTHEITCPTGSEGLSVNGEAVSLSVPTGWAFVAAQYAYADSNKKPQDVHATWNGKTSLPLSEQFQGQSLTLGYIQGTLIKQ